MMQDVDGGLVGGVSLDADEPAAIIEAGEMLIRTAVGSSPSVPVPAGVSVAQP